MAERNVLKIRKCTECGKDFFGVNAAWIKAHQNFTCEGKGK